MLFERVLFVPQDNVFLLVFNFIVFLIFKMECQVDKYQPSTF